MTCKSVHQVKKYHLVQTMRHAISYKCPNLLTLYVHPSIIVSTKEVDCVETDMHTQDRLTGSTCVYKDNAPNTQTGNDDNYSFHHVPGTKQGSDTSTILGRGNTFDECKLTSGTLVPTCIPLIPKSACTCIPHA